MDIDDLIDHISVAMQAEYDLAQNYYNAGNFGLYIYHEGLADGLRRALRYAEIREATKKAAMPASTAADDPHEETNNVN